MPAGEVYQFHVTEDGVYRIDYELLKEAGVAVNQLDPNQIHVYSQRGGAVPQSNLMEVPQLTELAIYPLGFTDSTFDQEDYFLVYAEGPDQMVYDPLNNFYEIQQNYVQELKARRPANKPCSFLLLKGIQHG